MSSPIRQTNITLGNLYLDEKLSPIKLSLISDRSGSPSQSEKENIESHHSVSLQSPHEAKNNNENGATLVTHPHGLQAKLEARRNTIHYLANSKTPAKSAVRAPLTSPRMVIPSLKAPEEYDSIIESPSYRIRSKRVSSIGANDSTIYLQGIGKKPVRLSPDAHTHDLSTIHMSALSSSPSKKRNSPRTFRDLDMKMSKIISNAEEVKATASGLVIDDDSDPEELDTSIHSNVNATKSTADNFTIVHRQKGFTDNDYITPQRLTEPVAKSPEAARVNELTGSHLAKLEYSGGRLSEENSKLISPLEGHVKDKIDQSELSINSEYAKVDENLTISFLLSPKSKPVFSVNYVKKLQNRHYGEMEGLESTIESKDRDYLKLSEELTTTKKNLFENDRLVQEHNSITSKLRANEELLEIQIKQCQIELASALKKLKLKDSVIYQTEAKLSALRTQHEEKVNMLENKVSALRTEIEETEAKLTASIEAESTAQSKATQLQEELLHMRAINEESNKKIEEMMLETGSLMRELRQATESRDQFEQESLDLEAQLKEKNEANNKLNTKFGEFVKDTEQLHNEMAKIEHEHKENERELAEKLELANTLNEKLEVAETRLREVELLLDASAAKQEADMTRYSELKSESAALLKELRSLKDQNTEKDRIISGDTRKLNELVEQVNKQKQLISDYKTGLKAEIDVDSKAESTLMQQIASLKHQVATAQQKTDERIQEVAEQLYHQYSKKHELKVNQLKDKYELKIKERASELEMKAREIETLESQLRTEMKEKNFFMALVERNEASQKSKRSPKK